ncbi:MAG: sigma-70 family RNA polymerase sigma factor [Candidatus Thiodiazotropha sp. (ex Myrtea spinifera)]|nr:sigma-70 family RNA polymerase sigma factor [Candidatus Thiodiazotropha sp. (ex Myrtea spinifera)]
MDGMSDEALFNLYRKGDASAFEVLYQRYRQSLYLFLLRTCDSPADADELYQDAWSRIITATKPFGEGSFKAYVFRIARNLQIDRFRRAHLKPVSDDEAMQQVSDPAPTPDVRANDLDCTERMKQQLASLPKEQSEAFLLKEEGGFTLEQIAEMVSVGRETIKSRLRYALKQLRKMLEDCL